MAVVSRAVTSGKPRMNEDGSPAYEVDFITIAFPQPLPVLHAHHKLEMLSFPALNQKEYEKKIMSLGPVVDNPLDDEISIICPGEVDGDLIHKFMMLRSSLKRSATLNQFFESKHYRYGCGMTLHFTQVPGACFLLVKEYLENGPDRYTTEDMINQLSTLYTIPGKRLEIYVRLHKSARQLELAGLKKMAWEAIKEEDNALTTEHCVTLASLVFAEKAGYGHQIKTWLIDYIKEHFEALSADPVVKVDSNVTWSGFVNTLSPGFKKEWKKLVDERNPRLSVVAEEPEGSSVVGEEPEGLRVVVKEPEEPKLTPEKMDEKMDGQDHLVARLLKSLDNVNAELTQVARILRIVKLEKDSSAKNGVVPQVNVTDTDNNTNEISTAETEFNEWQALDHFDSTPQTTRVIDFANVHPEIAGPSVSPKAQEILGAPMEHLRAPFNPRFSAPAELTPREEEERNRRSFDVETWKARTVLGMNTESGGTIAGRRKKPTLTRAAKSLSNLMRSSSVH